MSMGIGTNTQKADAGELNRTLEEVACGAWFTSKGVTIPKLIKYQAQDGMIYRISPIYVLEQEKKYYCGIPIWEYRCSAIIGEREHWFRLYYYMESNSWKILWERD